MLFNEVLKLALKEKHSGFHVVNFGSDYVNVTTSEIKVQIKKNSVSGTFDINTIKSFKLSDFGTDLTVRGNTLTESKKEFMPGFSNVYNGAVQHFPAGFFNAKWLKIIGKHDVRYYLNGLNIKRENNSVELAGSDGHQLINTQLTENGDDFNVIILRDVLTLLSKVKENFSMTLSDDKLNAMFQSDSWTIESRLINARYPDFNNVFNQAETTTIEVNRKDMIQTLKDIKPFLKTKFFGVFLNVETGNLHFEHEGVQIGTMRAKAINGGASLAFSADYLIAALDCYTLENIELSFLDSCLQLNRNGSQTNVVMSMRL
jgi:hypothetical protein